MQILFCNLRKKERRNARQVDTPTWLPIGESAKRGAIRTEEYVLEYAKGIQELDPTFVLPNKKQLDPQKAKSKKTLIIVFSIIGALFVAAAICGLIIIL